MRGYRVKGLQGEHGGKGTRVNAKLRIEFGPVRGASGKPSHPFFANVPLTNARGLPSC